MTGRALVVVAIAVISGCSAVPLPATDAAGGSGPTPTPMATSSPTPEPPQNPWRADPVTVVVNGSSRPDRDFRPMADRALAYWNGNATRYSGFAVRFARRGSARQPDVELRFVDSIPRCAGYDPGETIGCAPFYTRVGQADGTTVIEIRNDLSNGSTVETIKHELGHALGINHNESPMPLMAPIHGDSELLPVRNASDRPLPYRSRTLTVAVDRGPGVAEAAADRGVSIALEYFAGGADGWLRTTPTFTRTDDETAAAIVIRLRADAVCEFGSGVCMTVDDGEQLDSDGALEFYTRSTVRVGGVDEDELSWFVAYGVAFALGADNRTDLPPPLRDQTAATEEWWS